MRLKRYINSIKREGISIPFFKFLRNILTYIPPRLYHLIPSYFFYRIFKGEKLVEINNFKYNLDLKNDQGISRELYFYKKREFLSTDYLLNQNIIQKNDVVLDIGANIGYYALLESRLVGENGKVYALEPVDSNFKSLKKNIQTNNIQNIDCYKLAAGKENKKDFINVSRKGNLSSFVDDSDLKNKEKVKVVKIDDFLKDKKFPSFIRMDVEGFEWAIIKGMKNELKKDLLKNLLIEIHPQLIPEDKLREMFITLINSGFSKAKVIFEHNPSWVDKNGSLRPVVKFIMRKIEDRVDFRDKILDMGLNDLLEFLLKEKQVIHAHFYKIS